MREKMMDIIIKKYGFESKKTVDFCRFAEKEKDIKKIKKVFKKLLTK